MFNNVCETPDVKVQADQIISENGSGGNWLKMKLKNCSRSTYVLTPVNGIRATIVIHPFSISGDKLLVVFCIKTPAYLLTVSEFELSIKASRV